MKYDTYQKTGMRKIGTEKMVKVHEECFECGGTGKIKHNHWRGA